MKRSLVRSIRMAWRLALPILIATVPVPALALDNPDKAANATSPVDANGSPTAVKVLGEYVTVVGGVVAALGAVFGLPLVYQTFQKTRAEIRKINFETEKLEAELRATVNPAVSAGVSSHDVKVRIEGGLGNAVTIMTDTRFSIPLLLLVDGMIAYVYYGVASFAIDLIPLPKIFVAPLYLILFALVFLPLLRTAKEVKHTLGRAWLPPGSAIDDGSRKDALPAE